jgi:hypothetical protein
MNSETDLELDAALRGVEEALEAQQKAIADLRAFFHAQNAPVTLDRAHATEVENEELHDKLVTLTETWLHKAADASKFQSATARVLAATYAECADDLLKLLAYR